MIIPELVQYLNPWQPMDSPNWYFDQIKYHYDVILGKMLQNEAQSPDDVEVPYLKAQHIQWDHVQITDLPTMWASPQEIATLQVKKNDLIVCEGGEVGRAATISVAPSETCIIQNALHLVRPKSTSNTRFLRYLLQHATSHAWLDVLCNRATIAHFTSEKFREMWVWLPPLSEQRTIANYLDRATAQIDAMIAAKQRLLELLAEKRRALITHAVTRGLDETVPMRDSGVEWLGEIPRHWRIVKIKHMGQVGNGSTPLRDNESYWKKGVFPWLTSTVVNDDIVSDATDFVTEVALKECHLPIVQSNSVLIAITGEGKTRGKAALLPYSATINQHMAFVTPKMNLLNSQFLQLFLSGSYEILRLISEGTGSTKGALTCEQIGDFPVPLPPLIEQQRIISKISSLKSSLDSLIDAVTRTIDLLQERRTALIAAAVTGTLELPEPSCN